MNKLGTISEWMFTIGAGLGLGWVIAFAPPPAPPVMPPLPPSLIAPESQWAASDHCGCGAKDCTMPCSNCCAPDKCICHDNPAPTIAGVDSLISTACQHH